MSPLTLYYADLRIWAENQPRGAVVGYRQIPNMCPIARGTRAVLALPEAILVQVEFDEIVLSVPPDANAITREYLQSFTYHDFPAAIGTIYDLVDRGGDTGSPVTCEEFLDALAEAERVRYV